MVLPRRPKNPTPEGPAETIDGKDRHHLLMGWLGRFV
jgi:hypothetical protein